MILAKTIKGYGMGEAGEGQNITHQQKKMNEEALLAFRDRFELELTDEQVRDISLLQAAGALAGGGVHPRAPRGAGRLAARAPRARRESLPTPELERLPVASSTARATARSRRR